MAKRQNLDSTITIGSALSPTFNRTMASVRGGLRTIGSAARDAALVIGGVGAALFGVAATTAAAGDEIAKNARAIGISTDAYQELRYAAERTGVGVGTLDSSLTAFSKRLGEAQQGTGAARDAIAALGLSVDDLAAMEPEVALGAVADAMQDIESPTERSAIAADLFSRSGIKMVNLLGEGSLGMTQLAQDARETGNVLSEDALANSEEFQDSLLNMQQAFAGLKNAFGAELMPVFTDGMERLTDYLVDNRDEVVAFAKAFVKQFEAMLPQIGKVAEGLGSVASVLGRVVDVAADATGGLDNLVAAAGTFFAAKFIGAAFATTPIGIALGATAAAVYLIYENWDLVREKFAQVYGFMKERVDLIAERIRRLGDAVRDFLSIDGSQRAPGDPSGPRPYLNGDADRNGDESGQVSPMSAPPAPDRGGERNLLSPASAPPAPARGGGRGSVVQNITIQAMGTSAAEVADEIERRRRSAERMALFDSGGGAAQYG